MQIVSRLGAVACAAIVSIALAFVSTDLAGRFGGAAAFVLFLISLPWVVSVYVVSMIFNSTSPLAVDITLVVVTLAVWRICSSILLRRFVGPRER